MRLVVLLLNAASFHLGCGFQIGASHDQVQNQQAWQTARAEPESQASSMVSMVSMPSMEDYKEIDRMDKMDTVEEMDQNVLR